MHGPERALSCSRGRATPQSHPQYLTRPVEIRPQNAGWIRTPRPGIHTRSKACTTPRLHRVGDRRRPMRSEGPTPMRSGGCYVGISGRFSEPTRRVALRGGRRRPGGESSDTRSARNDESTSKPMGEHGHRGQHRPRGMRGVEQQDRDGRRHDDVDSRPDVGGEAGS